MEASYYTTNRPPRPLIGLGGRSQRGRIDGDQERELRSFALLAADRDLAVVVLDDLAADRQAKAHPDGSADVGLDVARRVERLERVLRRLLVHAAARVRDRNPHAPSALAQVPRLGRRQVLSADGEHATLLQRVDRDGEEVHEHLLGWVGVSLKTRKSLLEAEVYR